MNEVTVAEGAPDATLSCIGQAKKERKSFMEENQLSQDAVNTVNEPAENADNSNAVITENNPKDKEEKSNDPSSLILGKFKSADDLTEAYKQLEKLQGNQSSELGMLREKVASMNNNNEMFRLLESVYQNREHIIEAAKKYPEYFADPSFKQIYSEAYRAFGADLDVDRLVNLIEGYTSARIFAHEKSKSAEAETKQVIDGIKFEKNDKTITTPVKKSIQQMSPKELDEMLEKLI